MATKDFNAPSRPDPRGAPATGVIHVRTRLTGEFTILANALAQRRGSAVTVGVAAYILSLPDGAPVSIAALCAHFSEGEILISRALRELESAGYLERRRERTAGGRVRTRTFFYDVPGGGPDGPGGPRRPKSPAAERPAAPRPADDTPAPAPEAVPADAVSAALPTGSTPPPPLGIEDADPHAVVLLASLRILDGRLVLTRGDVAELAPRVAELLASGVTVGELTRHLTTGLPGRLRTRPVRLIAYRLRDAPIPAPPVAPEPVRLPWQSCDTCERPFRGAAPATCRDCREDAAAQSRSAAEAAVA
ncbi:hypothetical protein ACIQU5_26045 [Streptomyces sp. NPDC090306]|uniref:hypothetical protein n=1 Tax=Streptomyces sp. NPDC090306 TaxID=3365961 RepID=UPI00380F3BA3